MTINGYSLREVALLSPCLNKQAFDALMAKTHCRSVNRRLEMIVADIDMPKS